MRVLVVNIGSSSVKLRLLEGDRLIGSEDPAIDRRGPAAALASFLAAHPSPEAVGHRVVHGGPRFTEPVLVTPELDADLARLTELAPLHNPQALAGIEAMAGLRPDLPQVACFDTSFHATMPPEASTYAVPGEWRERYGIRRYGFHGLSHAWSSGRAAELLDRPVQDLRLVTAHLGSGASLAAVAGGRSVDTTMGFTPLDGLVMATRAGALDPGAVVFMARHAGLGPDQLEDALARQSGLAGLTGGSGDFRALEAAVDGGDRAAAIAYGVYEHRLRTSVAAMTGALGGLDGLVFTGGVGEGSARLRADVCAGLAYLGLAVDPSANRAWTDDSVVSPSGAAAAVVVVRAREDIEIARSVTRILHAT
jgi:acetate kinase